MASIAPSDRRDTIHALSSGRPPAAIAIVRISGPDAGAILAALAGALPPPRTATLATLRDPAGDVVDRALVLWFPGPASATGEDLAELHLHGSVAIVDAASRTLSALGARQAEPGEFTRRAFLNGKLDAVDVETLGDLLTAQTDYQRREALARQGSRPWIRIERWADRLVEIAARLEAAIDHDEDDEPAPSLAVRDDITAVVAEMRAALAQPPTHRIRDGVRIVLSGPPNAGKSSLFNRLCEADAAIVSPYPGTTRDAVERSLDFGGYPVVIVDTAGLRGTDDPVERIGVDRAHDAVAAADIVLDLDEDAVGSASRIAVAAKSDARSGPVSPDRIAVSAVSGEGIDELRAAITRIVGWLLPASSEGALSLSAASRVADAMDALTQATHAPDVIVVAELLRLARTAFADASATDITEAMLDRMFARFCLGK